MWFSEKNFNVILPPRHSKSLAIVAVAFGVGMSDIDVGLGEVEEAADFVGMDVFKLKRSKFEFNVAFSAAAEEAFLGGDVELVVDLFTMSFGLCLSLEKKSEKFSEPKS